MIKYIQEKSNNRGEGIKREEQKSKKVKLVIAIAILMILFIVFGTFIKSTPESREDKVISYLKKKYGDDILNDVANYIVDTILARLCFFHKFSLSLFNGANFS